MYNLIIHLAVTHDAIDGLIPSKELLVVTQDNVQGTVGIRKLDIRKLDIQNPNSFENRTFLMSGFLMVKIQNSGQKLLAWTVL